MPIGIKRRIGTYTYAVSKMEVASHQFKMCVTRHTPRCLACRSIAPYFIILQPSNRVCCSVVECSVHTPQFATPPLPLNVTTFIGQCNYTAQKCSTQLCTVHIAILILPSYLRGTSLSNFTYHQGKMLDVRILVVKFLLQQLEYLLESATTRDEYNVNFTEQLSISQVNERLLKRHQSLQFVVNVHRSTYGMTLLRTLSQIAIMVSQSGSRFSLLVALSIRKQNHNVREHPIPRPNRQNSFFQPTH